MLPLDAVEKLARVFKAFSDETRLRLVKTLTDLEADDALCVNALAARLGVSQPAVSQHLAVLRAADLVIGERRGYHVHYRLSPEGLAAYRAQAFALLGEQFMASPARDTSAARRGRHRRARRGEQMHDKGRAAARAGDRRPS
jgi:DNA-binding transcriptional ArsR family regulator